ncbi:Multidrug resistance protein MexB [Rahnella aquatilis]|nr:Multidrug resistance protein MexB [Rahnella aquatilis]
MSSNSGNNGSYTLTITFASGTDPDTAAVEVQNRISQVSSRLPPEVLNTGVSVRKQASNILMGISLLSPENTHDMLFISNFASIQLRDALARVDGVGDVRVFGSRDYSMRIWLDPRKMEALDVSSMEISAAIQNQNVQAAAGQIGASPSPSMQQQTLTISGAGRLSSPEAFGNIIVRKNAHGGTVRLRDVARIELGAQDYQVNATLNQTPSAFLSVYPAPGANALNVANAVREEMSRQARNFPDDLTYEIKFDSTRFVSATLDEIAVSLVLTFVVVLSIVYLFLQSMRATFIVALTIPVSLLGTFAVLYAFGYSANTLSLFAIILALTVVVDDAIVVVENVERLMMEDPSLGRVAATRKALKQIAGPVIATTVVLLAVFVPIAVLPGITGALYRQFAVTLSAAVVLSSINALTLTPALCATLLKPRPAKPARVFHWFNQGLDAVRDVYVKAARGIRKNVFTSVVTVLVIGGACVWGYSSLPKSFLPDEDQAVMFVQATLPANASAERTQQVLDNVREYLMTQESGIVSSVFTANGFSFAGRGQNVGIAFVQLKTWADRPAAAQKVQALAGRAMAHFATIKDARVFAFVPPAVMELGNATGFDFFLQDTNGKGHEALMAARNQFLQMASQDKRLMAVRPNGMEDEPQYQLEIDDERAQALGLSLDDINNTLSAAWGSAYVNQFMYNDRVKRVYIQGKAASRVTPEDLNNWYFRNSSGDMVPWSAFGSGKWVYGSPRYERFNGVSSVELMGSPAPGYSSGDANEAVMEIAAKLPPGYKVAWHGLSYEEKLSGSQTPALYSLSMIVVFLCLAALYESWSIPFSVMLVVPLGILGTIGAVLLRGLSNDVFFQVGLLTTVGLAAKNAILIVEFAKELHENEGMSVAQAAIEAAKLRIRPIIMTSMAFVLGVFPLTISSGAGAGSQHSIGTAVVGGMLTATFLAIFFVPMFYVTVVNLFTRKSKKHDKALPAPEATHHE